MATRPVVPLPQQQRGGVVPNGKQKKHAAVTDGNNNRRALGDIGNVVDGRPAEGKQVAQVSRPITRSFGAQLLAKAQEAAKAEAAKADAANKKTEVVNPNVCMKKEVKKITTKLKATTVNPKQDEVIKISPNTDEIKKKSLPAASVKRSSMRKKGFDTLSSILTARSKEACSLNDKVEEAIHDIDSQDSENQLAVSEYVEDLYNFYKLAEKSSVIHHYMDSQIEINDRMRAILTDWLIEVHNKFELAPETLYLTVHIVDRFLSLKTVARRELQLVGMSAMLIACKYEEIWAPEVNDFICISDRAYGREQILAMEKGMLNKLEWSLTIPTPYVFLVRFLKAAASDKEMEHMVFFYAELSLMQYCMITFRPSMIAASAVYTARCTLKKSPLWTETLRRHTGFSEEQLQDCSKLMVQFHSLASESKLKVVFRKYSKPERETVALRAPPIKKFSGLHLRDDATPIV